MKPTPSRPHPRICIVNYFLYNIFQPETKKIFGGAEVQLYYLIRALQRHGWNDIHVVSERPETGALVVEARAGVTFWRVRDLRHRPLRNFFQLLHCVWYLWKIDAGVYMNRAASIETGVIALLCRMRGRKAVFMVAHSLDVDGTYVRDNSWLAGKMYEFGLRHSTVLAQNEEQLLALLKRYGIEAQLLPNSFELPEESTTENGTDILWVGRAHRSKQPELFLELAERFPQEHFVMIMNKQDESVLKAVQARAAELPNVKLILGVPFFEINSYFKRAKLVVNTSSAEGFPNTFIQAGMWSCPILSLAINPDSVLTNHEMGWYAAGDHDRFLTAFSESMQHQQLRARYGANARTYVAEHHNVERNSEVFEALLG